MLNLHVNETKVATGTIPVSWSLDDEALGKIREFADGAKPYLVLIVAPKDNYHASKETRIVVPLTDRLAYVQCHYPGANNLYAMVAMERSLSTARDTYLSKRKGQYSSTLLTDCGDRFLYRPYFIYPELTGVIEIVVPAECFAKEPPAWEKQWVLWMFRDKGVDQCDYRKRRLFAYSVQLPLFLIIWTIRLLWALLHLGLTIRGVRLRALYQPLTYSTADISDNLSPPLFWIKSERVSNPVKMVAFFGLIPFMPLVFLLAALFGIYNQPNLPVWQAVWYGLVGPYIVFGIIGLVLVIIGIADWIYHGGIRDVYVAIKNTLVREQPFVPEEFDELTYKTGLVPDSLTDLPPNRRTVRLIFWDIKAKICRPFAG